MKTIIYVRAVSNPSSYYRIIQYVKQDSPDKIKLVYYSPKIFYQMYTKIAENQKYKKKFFQLLLYLIGSLTVMYHILWDIFYFKSDNVIVSRRFFPRRIPVIAKKLLNYYLSRRTVHWDFDDNILFDKEISPSEARILLKNVEMISVTSDFLKETLPPEIQKKTRLIPTTDASLQDFNVSENAKSRESKFAQKINLLWVGTKVNLVFVEDIISELDKAAKVLNNGNGKKLELTIICNEPLKCKTKHLEIRNINWSRDVALFELKRAHIGIMPLRNTEFTLGKGGFKAVQYIGAGTPAIVSGVGFNFEVVENGVNGFIVDDLTEWTERIVEVSSDIDKWKLLSKNAREKWERDFNSADVGSYWEQVFRNQL